MTGVLNTHRSLEMAQWMTNFRFARINDKIADIFAYPIVKAKFPKIKEVLMLTSAVSLGVLLKKLMLKHLKWKFLDKTIKQIFARPVLKGLRELILAKFSQKGQSIESKNLQTKCILYVPRNTVNVINKAKCEQAANQQSNDTFMRHTTNLTNKTCNPTFEVT